MKNKIDLTNTAALNAFHKTNIKKKQNGRQSAIFNPVSAKFELDLYFTPVHVCVKNKIDLTKITALNAFHRTNIKKKQNGRQSAIFNPISAKFELDLYFTPMQVCIKYENDPTKIVALNAFQRKLDGRRTTSP